MEKENMKRPICLELNDAKREIFDSITTIATKRNIPYFLLQYVLFEALTQVKNGANTELEQANILYQKQIAEMSEKK